MDEVGHVCKGHGRAAVIGTGMVEPIHGWGGGRRWLDTSEMTGGENGNSSRVRSMVVRKAREVAIRVRK